MKRVLITAGGTGGHIYPAIALGEKLSKNVPAVDILFAGGNLALNPYFKCSTQRCLSVSCGALPLSKPWKWPGSLFNIGKGVLESSRIIAEYKPDLVVGFGSYYTLPLLLAAKRAGVPFILHEANSIPGKVNRLMASSALVTAIHFPATKDAFKGATTLVDMPLRQGCQKHVLSREAAASYYQLDAEKETVLIFGGSQGARLLNRPLDVGLSQLIHITGDQASVAPLELAYKQLGVEARVKAFEENMAAAYTLSSFALCRAGAGTIAELIEFELPALLIPYALAAENHQEYNARFFVERAGGGVMLREQDFTLGGCFESIAMLREGREEMRRKIGAYKVGEKRAYFHELVLATLSNVNG